MALIVIREPGNNRAAAVRLGDDGAIRAVQEALDQGAVDAAPDATTRRVDQV